MDDASTYVGGSSWGDPTTTNIVGAKIAAGFK